MMHGAYSVKLVCFFKRLNVAKNPIRWFLQFKNAGLCWRRAKSARYNSKNECFMEGQCMLSIYSCLLNTE